MHLASTGKILQNWQAGDLCSSLSKTGSLNITGIKNLLARLNNGINALSEKIAAFANSFNLNLALATIA
jgi:hypothetical protein